jgi:hypothetical protein
MGERKGDSFMAVFGVEPVFKLSISLLDSDHVESFDLFWVASVGPSERLSEENRKNLEAIILMTLHAGLIGFQPITSGHLGSETPNLA